MNIFVLHEHPIIAARFQCNKHIPKMTLETAQLLSTAHRVLDGKQVIEKTKNNRNIKRWKVQDEILEQHLYKATHYNHPCAVWARENSSNYFWLYTHFRALCTEFKLRFGKEHLCYTKLKKVLSKTPDNITSSYKITPQPLAMDDIYKTPDVVLSYQNYYNSKQHKFKMEWTKRPIPPFIKLS